LKRRFLWWSLGGGCLCAAAAALFAGGWDWIGFPAPPQPAVPSAVAGEALVAEADGTTRLGQSYQFQNHGIRAACLAGTPGARGAALGRFYPSETADMETALLAPPESSGPALLRWLGWRWLAVYRAPLTFTLPQDLRAELAGLSQVTVDRRPAYGRPFARWLTCAAAPELSAWSSAPLLPGGLAFGAAAQATVNGRPLLAGCFYSRRRDACQRNQIVLLVRPDSGHAYLSLAWPGLAGVVSGLNDAGLAVWLLPARSLAVGKGMPAPVAAQRVLLSAATLDEAETILRATPLAEGAVFLLGSGKENGFRIVEKTPAAAAVRKLRERLLAAGNVFLSPELKPDRANLAYWKSGPLAGRLQRLGWLLETAAGKLDAPVAVSLLRDRRGPAGEYLGLGHPLAIDTLEAAQVVIFDLGAKVAWISAGPDALGEFVPFALADFFPARRTEPTVPADPLLSGGYGDYLKYIAGCRQGVRLLALRRYREALSWIQEVRLLNAGDYRSYLLAARALDALGMSDEARYNYQQAKRLSPAYAEERAEIAGRLRHLRD
jgi:hypothetical protein